MQINRFEDVLRALREHPEWLEELRTIILTEELLALPTRFTALEERQQRTEQWQQRIDTWRGDVDTWRGDVDTWRGDVDTWRGDVDTWRQRVDRRLQRIEDRLGALEGEAVERRYRRNGSGYFGNIARKVRLLTVRERDDLLDGLEEQGQLTVEEATDIRLADGVFTARRDGQEVFLVLEASAAIDPGDVARAARRAELLSRSGTPAIAIVAGRAASEEVLAAASAAGVWVVTNGAARAPAA